MATVLPRRHLPTASAAEARMREAFETLSRDWLVLHSVAWQSVRGGRQSDGEADFVLIHAKHGLLVVEVKGGGIEVEDGHWSSIDRHGERHDIKNPFQQAIESKHALVGFLRDRLPTLRIPAGHAVAMPDVSGDIVSAQSPRAIAWDRDCTRNPQAAVDAAVAHWELACELRRSDVEAIAALLMPAVALRPLLKDEIADVERRLVELTDEQIATLEGLRRNRRAIVYGGAGTGKTVLAAHRATRLADQGFDVLLTCFNQPLANDLATRHGGRENLKIATFHGLCTEESRRAGLRWTGSGREWWDMTLPGQLVQAATSTGTSFDAIVVDEGQDFRADWWVTLQLMLRDPDMGPMYVFADTQQAIYCDDWAPPFSEPVYELIRNCRNTTPIARRVAAVFGDDDPIASAAGPEPVFSPLDEPGSMGDAMRAAINRLLKEEQVAPGDIAVLSTSKRVVNQLRSRKLGRLTFGPVGEADVVAETIHRFKGLEAPAVVLAVPEGDYDRSLLYIGLSRARSYLEVIGEPRLREALAWT